MANPRSRWPVLLLLLGMCAAGCGGAPVQEMSNARQAIKAAREAGAERVVPQTMQEAQTLLDRAEGSLQRRAYRDARRDALAAKNKAGEALSAAQAQAHNGTG